jgi:hypothetical protein
VEREANFLKGPVGEYSALGPDGSVATAQLCHSSTKAAMDTHQQMGVIPRKLDFYDISGLDLEHSP